MRSGKRTGGWTKGWAGWCAAGAAAMLAALALVAMVSATQAASAAQPTAKLAAAQPAQTANADEAAIRATLAEQVAAWNRGDIDGFMRGYENSPQTTFVGSTIAQGFAPILARYHKAYATRAEMGRLSFRELAVRLLPCASGGVDYAVVTGRFHLERTAHDAAAAKDDGVFSLVWRRGAQGWKIVLDHTS